MDKKEETKVLEETTEVVKEMVSTTPKVGAGTFVVLGLALTGTAFLVVKGIEKGRQVITTVKTKRLEKKEAKTTEVVAIETSDEEVTE